jgi:hypothetical protein
VLPTAFTDRDRQLHQPDDRLGPSTQYDTGGHNAVALDDQSNAVEVHVGTNRLFYYVGHL